MSWSPDDEAEDAYPHILNDFDPGTLHVRVSLKTSEDQIIEYSLIENHPGVVEDILQTVAGMDIEEFKLEAQRE